MQTLFWAREPIFSLRCYVYTVFQSKGITILKQRCGKPETHEGRTQKQKHKELMRDISVNDVIKGVARH